MFSRKCPDKGDGQIPTSIWFYALYWSDYTYSFSMVYYIRSKALASLMFDQLLLHSLAVEAIPFSVEDLEVAPAITQLP